MIDQSFENLVRSFAAKTPTPGGGAAAAMSACLGTSLLLMTIRFSRGKKATLEHDGELAAVEQQLDQYLTRLLPMAERDCASFDHVSLAYKLPKDTDDEKDVRGRAIEESMIGARGDARIILLQLRPRGMCGEDGATGENEDSTPTGYAAIGRTL